MTAIRKWIVAHRGDASAASENTLAAFQAAISAGADMIELDVQQLADGILVVFHDDEIGGERLAEIGFARLHEYALLLDREVPTLRQTLDLCNGRILLDVEVKNAREDDVLRALANARLRINDYVLTSFDPGVLLNIRMASPGVQTGLLTENTDIDAAQKTLDRVAADFWAPNCKIVDQAVLSRCEQLRIRLLPWVVNSDDDLRRLFSAQSIAGIITDRMRRALEIRRTLGRITPDDTIP